MVARIWTLAFRGSLCCALSVGACGGNTRGSLEHGGQAGSGAGASPASGGRGAGGAIGHAGSSGGAGGSAGAGGSIGTGGRPTETGGRGVETGGSGGLPSWSCRTPYTPPSAGPRVDGPANPGVSCENLTDIVVLERYADDASKVPKGFFYEEPGEIVVWGDLSSCSPSLSATEAAARMVLGDIHGGTTTRYFYEAAGCNGDARTRYRQLRCDYFDGTHLKTMPSGSADDLLFWAGLIWFTENQNLGGATLVSGSSTIGNATDVAEICTTKTTYGDFGLCDMITLTSTHVSRSVDGTVMLVSVTDGRSIKGKCR